MVLAVGEQLLDQKADPIVRTATGFAGGVGSSYQEMCGTLSGGLLIIGALYGRDHLSESDQPAMDLAREYRERFAAELAQTRCGPLREWVHSPSGPGSCACVVERAASILLELLETR